MRREMSQRLVYVHMEKSANGGELLQTQSLYFGENRQFTVLDYDLAAYKVKIW